jgi:hypothetical protein
LNDTGSHAKRPPVCCSGATTAPSRVNIEMTDTSFGLVCSPVVLTRP